ncbi:MAG: DUF559 domain-containing protein [Acidobacteria bacterium]|nr:MAG: DUF559 domain-containing protein [Acidobacteriota bacterium]
MASEDRDRRLSELGRRQFGVVSRQQLLGLGFSPRSIGRSLTRQRLRVVHEGVYALGPQALTRDGRERAALLAIGPDPLLTHISSAARQDLMRSTATIHVSISSRVQRRLEGVIVHRPRRIDPEDRVLIDGLPMTSIPRTLLDLAQILPITRLEKVVESADRLEVLDIGAVRDAIERYRGHQGEKPLKRIIGRFISTPNTNEGTEREFQLFLRKHGLPTPQTNVLVEGLLVDCWWQEARFVVELDSQAWHKTWHAHERDRKRDATLLRAGISSLRITSNRLHREPDEVVRDLAAGLRLHGGAF